MASFSATSPTGPNGEFQQRLPDGPSAAIDLASASSPRKRAAAGGPLASDADVTFILGGHPFPLSQEALNRAGGVLQAMARSKPTRPDGCYPIDNPPVLPHTAQLVWHYITQGLLPSHIDANTAFFLQSFNRHFQVNGLDHAVQCRLQPLEQAAMPSLTEWAMVTGGLDHRHHRLDHNQHWSMYMTEDAVRALHRAMDRSYLFLRLHEFQATYLPWQTCALTHLTDLDISMKRLVMVPEKIANLSCLTRLVFTACDELSVLPNGVCALRELRVFKVVGCRRLTFLPTRLGELSKLQELDLHNCTRLASLPEKPPERLLTLNLQNSGVHRVPPSYFRANLTIDGLLPLAPPAAPEAKTSVHQVATTPSIANSSAAATCANQDPKQEKKKTRWPFGRRPKDAS